MSMRLCAAELVLSRQNARLGNKLLALRRIEFKDHTAAREIGNFASKEQAFLAVQGSLLSSRSSRPFLADSETGLALERAMGGDLLVDGSDTLR